MNSSIINEFYQAIEETFEVGIDVHKTPFPNHEELNDDERLIVYYEIKALLYNKHTVIQQEESIRKDEFSRYLNERILNTSNSHLLAKYNHYLLDLTQDNRYAAPAIDAYLDVVEYFLKHYSPDERKPLYISNVLEVIMDLSLSFKYKLRELKAYINELLLFHLRPKEEIFVLNKVVESKLFRCDELNNFPDICFNLYNDAEDIRAKERALELGIIFSQKSQCKGIYKEFNEKLGDLQREYLKPLDDNMVTAFHNERHYRKMIVYYKNAGNYEKRRAASKELSDNKINLKLPIIKYDLPYGDSQQLDFQIKNEVEKYLDCTQYDLVIKLAMDHTDLGFITSKALEESVQTQLNGGMLHHLATLDTIDVNMNSSINAPDKYYRRTSFYYSFQLLTRPVLFHILNRAISEKKLTYSSVKKALIKMSFGLEHYHLASNEAIAYTWFALVDIGIKEYFRQYLLALENKPTDWRMTIDFLTPKFEAILRDIVDFTGGIIHKEENGKTSLMLLEQLLNAPELREVFDDDDLMLFRQVFTKDGMNIRNDVAHGFYKPSHYNITIATLVFVCILRLNNYLSYHIRMELINSGFGEVE